jgi:hypothetical protein
MTPKRAIGVASDGALVFDTGRDERERKVLCEATVRRVGYLNDGTTWRLKPEAKGYPRLPK